MQKSVAILGSTGSIGENALRVVASLPDRFRVRALAAGRNAARLVEQAVRFGVRDVSVADEETARAVRSALGSGARVQSGAAGLEAMAAIAGADVVLCAVPGIAALGAVLAALGAGRNVAIATKEVLVSAGALVTATARENGARLIPVDSEHSAVFQVLAGRSTPVEKIWLTASGGPFFFRPDVDFSAVTPEMALAHPRWKMGPKVTIDSATMMNKGLETLEASWLFDVPADRIGALVHPESVVHSLVEFADGAQLAQLGAPDMRIPIQYALSWPERVPNATLPRLDLAAVGALHFHVPDERRFPCLALAREAARIGGLAPCVMNAANEAAVAAFLAGRIGFSEIPERVERAMGAVARGPDVPSLPEIMAADAEARRVAV